jgi:hypothetical protein
MSSHWSRVSGGVLNDVVGSLALATIAGYIVVVPAMFLWIATSNYFDRQKNQRIAEYRRRNNIPEPLPTRNDIDYAMWRGQFAEARQMEERVRMTRMASATPSVPSASSVVPS